MGDFTLVATFAGGIGSLVTAMAAVAVFLINRGRAEGDIDSLAKTMATLRGELETALGDARDQTDNAQKRIDAIISNHHALRETIARDYVTYERMRELKTELMSAMKSQTEVMAAISVRLDAIMHSITKLPQHPQNKPPLR